MVKHLEKEKTPRPPTGSPKITNTITQKVKTLIHNASVNGIPNSWILFDRRLILAVGTGSESLPEADETIDADGAMLLPGAIDTHVHFREPGLTHKATMATESRAALAGGVTTWFDMPNTKPPTVTLSAIEEKQKIAADTAVGNGAFFIGLTNDNLDEVLQADFTVVPGVKVFMGSSTGNMLVDDESTLVKAFKTVKTPIVVHAEDETTIAREKARAIEKYGPKPPVEVHSEIRPAEACVKATAHAIDLARATGARLHVAHLSTADEVELIRRAKAEGVKVTAEVSPSHLLFTTDDYAQLGARIKMNPSIKTAADRDALRQGLLDGTIDMIATDHAPHLLAEKQGGALEAVSGAPMVQFSVVKTLDLFGPEVMARAMAVAPARIFGIDRRGTLAPGMASDIILVRRLDTPSTITDTDVLSKCGWTPLDGSTTNHRVTYTHASDLPLSFHP